MSKTDEPVGSKAKLWEVLTSKANAKGYELTPEKLELILQQIFEHFATERPKLAIARNIEAFKLKYGLEEEEPMTYAAIGRQMELSRDRVRQMCNQVLSTIYLPRYWQ